jgi:hypothetical protein
MSNSTSLRSSISLPSDFVFGEVSPQPEKFAVTLPPTLGPLAAFAGDYTGSGFNTIFRPDSPTTPTVLPIPIPAGNDNILELNLTSESLSFSPSLGSVPNRGMVQADAFLNGVPYLQTIKDVTNPHQPVGIHAEPGLWMIVPLTTDPAEGQTLVRMASIPHGTTIEAQGTSTSIKGAPTIPPVGITPSPTAGGPLIRFASQTAATPGTPRIPQDLSSFISAGSITQAILDDPNTVLRNHISGQTITDTTLISIATTPPPPLFGGGVDNIAFLLGDKNIPPSKPNAQTLKMTATFWIETVELKILVPIFRAGQPPLTIRGMAKVPGQPVPTFSVKPPFAIPAPREIIVTFTQIQYSQTVILNFNGLAWPHVSVATLVPADVIEVPPSVFGSGS